MKPTNPTPPCSICDYPATIVTKIPPGTPDKIKTLFLAASAIRYLAHEASAALGRLCLREFIFTSGCKTNPGDRLRGNIISFLDQHKLPPDLYLIIDQVRTTVNTLGHPLAHRPPGEIISSSSEHADWLIKANQGLIQWWYGDTRNL